VPSSTGMHAFVKAHRVCNTILCEMGDELMAVGFWYAR